VTALVLAVLLPNILQDASASTQNKMVAKSATAALPQDLPGVARLVRDDRSISVMEFSGDYDAGLNEPRKTIAKEFFRTHADVYDFLVIYSSFEFPTTVAGADASAFYNHVRNDTLGIGQTVYDNSPAFGSQNVLQGYIDMAAVTRWASTTSAPDYDVMLSVFAHELQHRWGSYVKFRNKNGAASTALLGQDASHWSYLLDSQGSVHYGALWRDNGDGSFTATETRDTYSPLDLYLAGMIDKSKVPPFTLIDAPGIDPTQLPPPLGTTIKGVKQTVTVDDIIAVEGPRVPAADVAPKAFRFAFIFLVRPGETIDPVKLDVVAKARREVGLRYNALTHGLGTANVFAEPAYTLAPGTPESILPIVSGTNGTPGGSTAGMAWLEGQQKADGSFQDAPGLAPRDTLLARAYLRDADPNFVGLGPAKTWIDASSLQNTDFFSRRLIESSGGERRSDDVSALLALRNADGGWGLGGGLRSTPLDTALAIQALRLANADASTYQAGVPLLVSWQNADGGWGNVNGGPSRVNVSTQALKALNGLVQGASAVARVETFFSAAQHADGGFGEGVSSVHDTANTALALADADLRNLIHFAAAQSYVANAQRLDGSWQGSVYSTVLALKLLRQNASANLAIGSLQAAPQPVYDGQRVTLSATVTNLGSAQAQATTVRFFDGDPAKGGVAIGSPAPVPALVGGDSLVVHATWNTTSLAGAHTLFAVVDYEQLTNDLVRQDNTATLPISVGNVSNLADVLVTDDDVSATPSTVTSLPAEIRIDALVSNAGLASVTNAKAALWSGTGANRIRVADTTFSVAGRSTTALQFRPTLTNPGSTVYTVELDPDNVLTEATHANNSASVTVNTAGGVSLAVANSDITLTPAVPLPGSDVDFTVNLHNYGTLDSTSFNVRYSIVSGSISVPLLTNVVQIPAGGAVKQTIPWRVDKGGDYTFVVEMDPEKVSGDNNYADNKATYDFSVAATAGLNLVVSYKDITFAPNPALEGSNVHVGAVVRNVGDVSASNIDVRFYDGDPSSGGVQIGAATVASLAPASSGNVAADWLVPTANTHLIFVVVDPLRAQPAETNLADNTAFANLPVLTLPDFAISPGSISLSPTVPRPGEAVTMTVVVSNLGDQAGSNLVVSAFDGTQAAGKKLAPDVVIPVLAGRGSASAQFAFTAPAAAGSNTITVVVNPGFTIPERVRDNNTVAFVASTQNADFALSEAYISPNGDGVKDSTVLTYRLPSLMSSSVQVTDSLGRVIRNSGSLAAATSSSWVWDGLDDDGRLAQDGKYELAVRDPNGVTLGGATVEIDTNRSSLLAAVGAPAGVNAALTCTIPNSSVPALPIHDDAGFYLNVSTAQYQYDAASGRYITADLPAGIYREDDWARGLRRVLGGLLQPGPNGDAIPQAWNLFVANDQGTRIVAYNAALQQLVSAAGEGDGSKTIFTGNINSLVGLSSDSAEVYATLGDGSLTAINTSTGARRSLGVSGFYAPLQSPDKKRLIVNSYANGSTLLVDLVAGGYTPLPATANSYYWSPNGVYLVGRKPDELALFDAEGNPLKEVDSSDQSGLEAWAEDSSELYQPMVPGCNTISFVDAKDCQVTVRRTDMRTGARADLASFTEKSDYYGTLTVYLRTIPGRYELLASYSRASESFAVGSGSGSGSGLRLIDLRSPYAVSWQAFSAVPPAVSIPPSDYFYGNGSEFIEYGRGLEYRASLDQTQPGACLSEGGDGRDASYVFRTLSNLQTDLVLSRQPDGVSVKIHGGVADKNFLRYALEYSSADSPSDWHAIIPPDTNAAWNKDLALWVTPGPGNYTVRLTAQDLAGNQVQKLRKINIAQAGPPITNVVRTPAFISPNGDGVQDAMTLNYRVLEPVNLDFAIYDSKGNLVRTIERSHPVGDVDAAMVWDGRDSRGQVVADGEYRINVVGFDFFVTVDNQAPVLNTLRSGPPFSFYDNQMLRTTELRWDVSDTNFMSAQLEVGDGAAPAYWRPYFGPLTVSNNLEHNGVFLPLADYVGQRYRLVVSDKAGNRTVAQFDPAQPAVQLIALGQILGHDLATGETPPAPGSLEAPAREVPDPPYDMRPAAGIGLVFGEALDEPIVAVSVQFNEDALAKNGEWLEQPNAQVYPLAAKQKIPYLGDVDDKNPPNRQIAAALEASALGGGNPVPQNYGAVEFFNNSTATDAGMRIRLKLTGRSGTVYFSNEEVIQDANVINFKDTVVSSAALSGTVLLKTARVAQKLEVFASSGDDPYFAIERKIYAQALNSVVPLTPFPFQRDGRYVSCAKYNLRAIATLDNGKTIQDSTVVSNCGGVLFAVRPDFAACGDSPPLQLHGLATPQPGPTGAVPLLSMEVYAQGQNGSKQLVFNVVNPEYRAYDFTFNHGALPEGIVTFIGVTTDRDNVVRSTTFDVPIDHTPSTVKITYPLENQRVCAVPELRNGLIVNALRPVAQIDDAAGFDYQLEFSSDGQGGNWQTVLGDLPSFSGPDPRVGGQAFEVQSPYVTKEFYSSPSGNKHRPYMSGKHIAGELGPIENISGQVTARLTSYDWSGAAVCRQVNFYLDGSLDAAAESLDRSLFSPGTSSTVSSLALTLNPLEAVAATTTVHRVDVVGGVRLVQPAVVRTLTNRLSMAAGATNIPWDGKDDAGNYVADGKYTFHVNYVDGCGNLKSATPESSDLTVEVDRTAPALQMDRPAAGNVSASFIDVFGSVSDAHLQQWVLEYSVDATPQNWTPLASGTSNKDLGKLATLDATFLQGTVTLRLRAVDQVELASEIVHVLKLQPHTPLIRAFSALPTPFSPNGDGRVDNLGVTYDVLQPVTVDLVVLKAGSVIRHLLTNAAASPGGGAAVWDGRDDRGVLAPDGEYTVEIKATSAADSSITQTEDSTVLLDVTPPVFTLQTSLQPFMPGDTAITGTLAELELQDYTVYVEGPSPSVKRVVLNAGTQTFTNGLLGVLSDLGLDDGVYRIRTIATDAAQNTSNFQSPDFELDSKPPVVSFSGPVSGSFASKVHSAHFAGLLADRNLLSGELTVGGTSIWKQTASAEMLPMAVAFDGGALPDGSYPAVLVGTDKAGNAAKTTITVNVDNTLPTAVITSPVANALIGDTISVVGTAADANIESWKLELGSGVGQAVDSLTVIARGTTSVNAAELTKLIGLPPDGPATLRLTVVDLGGNTSVVDVPLQIDATPPNPPVLTGAREGRSDVRLTWTLTNAATRIAGYNLYRNDIKLNSTLLTDLSYLDQALPDGGYAYSVTAVSNSGFESARSNVVNMTILSTGPIVQITKPVANATVSGLVSIEGSAYATNNFHSYRVEVGAGAAPTSWTVLRTSVLAIQGQQLATWSTVGLSEGAIYTLRLTADDTVGTVSTTSVTVTIDNLAPAKPTGLKAQISGSNDVSLNWNANTEPDLAGYLLYRDGVLVNQIDPSDNSIRPYLLVGTTYLDKARPDGSPVYTVVAVDKADNLSDRSDPASVTIDTRAPHAVIVEPLDKANVDGAVYIRAVSPDTDIASVLFQYKSATGASWVDIPGATAKVPYSVVWNTESLPNDTYLLRAIATDLTGHTDPTPESISVTRKNLQPPVAPTALVAHIDGGDVTLNWSASTSADIKGYYIVRVDSAGVSTRLNPNAPVTLTTYLDAGLPDATYRYQVLAANTSDTESSPTPLVPALVYTTQLAQPYTPVAAAVTAVAGKTPNVDATVAVTVTPQVGSATTTSVMPDAQGAFALDAQPLAMGANIFSARQVDASGNRSKAGTARVARGDLPAAPATVTATPVNGVFKTTWTASTSSDATGYVVELDGKPSPQPVSFVTATSSTDQGTYAAASLAIDAYSYSSWLPDPADPNPSIVVALGQRTLLANLSIQWSYYAIPTRYTVAAWDGYVWVPLKQETANTGNGVEIPLDPPYYTDRIRISFPASTTGSPAGGVGDVKANSLALIAGTSTDVPAPDGFHAVTVQTLSDLGLLGKPATSATAGIGNTSPPLPVVASISVDGPTATVSWTESTSPNVAKYEVLRDGSVVATVLEGNPLEFVDGPLLNGTYHYTVRPVSVANVTGPLSNEVVAVIALAQPGPPILQLTVPAKGSELDLSWQAPLPANSAVTYTVYRATTAGGPYTEVGSTDLNTLSFADTQVSNGTRYYYVVRASDAAGTLGPASNEVSGVPTDTVAPLPPVIFRPTTAGLPISVNENHTEVRVFGEPGALMTLTRGGQVLGSVKAFRSQTITALTAMGNAVVPAPTGDMVASVNYDTLTLAYVVPALDGTISQTVFKTVPGVGYYGTPMWSPDGTQVVVVSYAGLFVVKVADGSVSVSPFTGSVQELIWHPDGTRWIATTDFGSKLVEISVATGTSRTIASAPNHFSQFALSPDGQTIAAFEGGVLELVSLADGSRTAVPGVTSAVNGTLIWAGDAKSLYFLGAPVNATQNQVFRYVLGQAAPAMLTSLTEGVDSYSLSSFGSLLLLSGGEWEVMDAASNLADLGAAANGAYLVQWASSGVAFVSSNGNPTNALTLPGTAVFPSVLLNPGLNMLAAKATDAAGNTGSQSQPISVTYVSGALPDFSLQTTDVTVVPLVPKVGAPARITVVLNNVGGATAGAAGFNMVATSPSGVRLPLLATRTTPLAAGANQVFRTDATFSEAGTWQLNVVVDPDNEVEEISKDNNVIVLPVQVVDGSAGGNTRTLSISLEKSVYTVGDTLSGSVSLFNGSTDIAGQLNLRIEDSQGYVVAMLPARSLPVLPYGQTTAVPFSWVVPAIYDATYQVRATWVDNSTALGQATAPFTLQAKTVVSAQIGSDSSLYVAGTEARLVAQIDPAGSSPTTASAQAIIRVLRGDGSVASQWTDSIGFIAATQLVKTLDTTGLSAGRYSLELVVNAGGVQLARATSGFEVAAPASPTIGLTGDIVLDRNSVVYTGNIAGTATVTNTGSTDLSNVPYEVDVVDPLTNTLLARVPLSATNLLKSSTATSRFSFPAAGMPIGVVWIQLRTSIISTGLAANNTAYPLGLATADTSRPNGAAANDGVYDNLLRQRELSVFELDPPVVVINQPRPNAYLRAAQSVKAAATDLLTGVRSVEYQMDGAGTWSGMSLSDPVGSNYVGVLSALADGPHLLSVRATDNAGNVSQPVSRPFVVDSIPPAIAISGVVEGASYGTTVTPVVAITDVNLATTQILLNGKPYVSGTSLQQAGAYVLQVNAFDLAGNNSSATLRFSITAPPQDTTPPVIGILAPAEAAYIRRGGSGLIATIVDAQSGVAFAKYSVDGGAYAPLTIDTAQAGGNQYAASLDALPDGAHSVVVQATDTAGNMATSGSRSFIVDNTPPQITITGVTAGQYSASVTPVISVVDAALDTSTTTLNGTPYVSGTPIISDGNYTLTVTAVDKAGNTAASSIQFTLSLPRPDKTAPVVFIELPEEGAYVRAGGLLIVSATDTGSGVASVEEMLDAQTHWTNLAASAATNKYTLDIGSLPDGAHAASVRATDNAGNVAGVQVRHFTVDNTPPVIAVSGVQNNGQYAGSATASVSVSDTNLSSSSVILNGVPYVSGTPITVPGAYVLAVGARDLAGNETAVAIDFQINAIANAPVVSIVAPGAGAIVKSGTLLSALAQPASSVSRLEMAAAGSTAYAAMQPRAGGAFDLPIPTLVDGTQTLRVRAVGADRITTYPDVVQSVVIDSTPPAIDTLGLVDGAKYTLDYVVNFRVSDLHLADVVATMDGQPFSAGQRVANVGPHTLQIIATDLAGNQTSKSVAFITIPNASPPVPVPLWPMDRRLLTLLLLAMLFAAAHRHEKSREK
jgi:flagellar hook assembly protein FlgD/fibronectin type 3 domain-containing protein